MPQGNDSDSSESSSTYIRRLQRQVFCNDDIRVESPDFEGRLQPDEFVDWTQTGERIFDYKVIPEEDKGPIFDEEPAYDEEITPVDQEEIYDASEDDEGPIFDQEPVYDEEFTPADQGESLMIRQNLHTAAVKVEPSMRHNIFHSQEKICDVIIDSGKYQDETWYDVIPMDDCHFLLERLWPYDCRVMYNGNSNTYSYEMTPLPPSELNKGKKEPQPLVSLISRAQFKVTAEEAQTVSLFLFCEAKEETDLPSKIKEISHEFLDIVPEEVPPELPPERDIQHTISCSNDAELDLRTSLVQPGENVMENNSTYNIILHLPPPTTSTNKTLNGIDLIGLD